MTINFEPLVIAMAVSLVRVAMIALLAMEVTALMSRTSGMNRWGMVRFMCVVAASLLVFLPMSVKVYP